jgi:hypothetical protein
VYPEVTHNTWATSIKYNRAALNITNSWLVWTKHGWIQPPDVRKYPCADHFGPAGRSPHSCYISHALNPILTWPLIYALLCKSFTVMIRYLSVLFWFYVAASHSLEVPWQVLCSCRCAHQPRKIQPREAESATSTLSIHSPSSYIFAIICFPLQGLVTLGS